MINSVFKGWASRKHILKWPNREERNRFSRFVIAGILNTIVVYLLYLLLLYFGVQYLIALTVDYALGICLGYLMNRHWTFRSTGQPQSAFLKYAASCGGAYLLNLALLFTFVAGLAFDERIAQIPALAVVTLINYGAQRFWVFRPT